MYFDNKPNISNEKVFFTNETVGENVLFMICDSGGIQTPNLLIRSQMLYSVEPRSHVVLRF